MSDRILSAALVLVMLFGMTLDGLLTFPEPVRGVREAELSLSARKDGFRMSVEAMRTSQGVADTTQDSLLWLRPWTAVDAGEKAPTSDSKAQGVEPVGAPLLPPLTVQSMPIIGTREGEAEANGRVGASSSAEEHLPYKQDRVGSNPTLPPSSARLQVRLTYYLDAGTTRYGCPTLPGMAATDPRVIRPGSIFRIEGWPTLFYACDTGDFHGQWVDVWVPSDAAGRAMVEQLGEYVEIEVLQEAP